MSHASAPTDTDRPVLVWLRDDLRLADHPAFAAAAESGAPVISLYVLEEGTPRRPLGGASRWWLGRSLAALATDLARLGGRLTLRRGDPGTIVPAVAASTGARLVTWNRRYDRQSRAIDDDIEAKLRQRGVAVAHFAGALIAEPATVTSKSGTPFRVFTPFWRSLVPRLDTLAEPPPRPRGLRPYDGPLASDRLDDWQLQPTAPDWSSGLAGRWRPGEAGAQARLAAFIDNGLGRYAAERDYPACDAVSGLSPHLRFGEVAVARVIAAVRMTAARQALPAGSADKFLSEIGWREFAWHTLSHFPDLAIANFQPAFDRFPWAPTNDRLLSAWTGGRTGYPIVDAGMRELWQTGFMHNRVRMIAASFLTKHLRLDWRTGEQWFWDTLVDADPASNPFGWQWVAGSGADAAPYFRVFNPTLQGETYDPEGRYVRTYVPELRGLPDRLIHRPGSGDLFAAPTGYPPPIVDHAAARAAALAAFASLGDDKHHL